MVNFMLTLRFVEKERVNKHIHTDHHMLKMKPEKDLFYLAGWLTLKIIEVGSVCTY